MSDRDVLTYFTLNAVAYFMGFFSQSYGNATVWAFGFHTAWCMIFGDLSSKVIGIPLREIGFDKAWGFYLLNIFVWAWAGSNLRAVVRGPKFLDGRELRDLKQLKKRYSLLAIFVFFIYFILYCGSFVLFELKIIGVEPLGGCLTVVAIALITLGYYAIQSKTEYYPMYESKLLRNELLYFVVPVAIYGFTFVILDAVDFVYGKFDAWHTVNVNCWLSLAFGAVALIFYPIALSQLLKTPSTLANEEEGPMTKPAPVARQLSNFIGRYVRLE